MAILTHGIPVIYSCLPSHKSLLFLNPYLLEATDSTSSFYLPLRNHPSFLLTMALIHLYRPSKNMCHTLSTTLITTTVAGEVAQSAHVLPSLMA